MFKSKNVNVKIHPITKRLVQFKQMLDQTSEMDEVLKPKVQNLLENASSLGEPEEVEVTPVKKYVTFVSIRANRLD